MERGPLPDPAHAGEMMELPASAFGEGRLACLLVPVPALEIGVGVTGDILDPDVDPETALPKRENAHGCSSQASDSRTRTAIGHLACMRNDRSMSDSSEAEPASWPVRFVMNRTWYGRECETLRRCNPAGYGPACTLA